MAHLTLGGVTVPVRYDSPDTKDDAEVGTIGPAFDGSPRSSVRGYKGRWQIVTAPMPLAAANTLEAVLKGAPPVAATGTLTGSVNVTVTGIVRSAVGATAAQLAFVLLEA